MLELYIIHGWTYKAEGWDKTLEFLDNAGLKVHFLKVPGLTTPSDKVWRISDYAKWADEHIPDGSIALGHSNGGRILLNLCSEKPAKLAKLILLDAAGVYEPSLSKGLIRKIAKVGKPLQKIPLLSKVFHRLTGSTDYEQASANMKKTLENMLSSDRDLNLSAITTKTAILWGENDKITPIRHAHVLHDALDNSTLTTFKNWPHSPYLTDPEGLANAILKEVKNV